MKARIRRSLIGFVLLTFACDGGGETGDGDTGPGGDDGGQDACYIGDARTEAGEPDQSLMQTWGAPCTSDEDCKAILDDPDAICEDTAVIYELPEGYCTKPCELPDTNTTVIIDDPTCDPDGGVHCVGAKGFFQRCTVPCTDDAQCDRDGYMCRQMPTIAAETDPTFCLMPDCCEDCCSTEGCPDAD